MTFFCGFPCLLGLTILLLQTIFAGKKSNEKWKAQNKFVRFVQFVVKKNKRLTEREAWLTLKMGVLGVSGVSHQREFPNQVCSTAKC